VPKDTARRTRRYTHPFYPDKKLGQHRTVAGKGKVARLTRRQGSAA
jgi:ribosomal protein L31